MSSAAATRSRCAKVYKEANKRSFRQAVQYTEGRKVKNSRRARAMEKGSRYGRKEQEAGLAKRRGGRPAPACRRRGARAASLTTSSRACC